jgi:hypothetical protein
MSEEERRVAALGDPDAQPLTAQRMARMKRTPQVKVIRRALGLSQEDLPNGFRFRSALCAIGSRVAKTRTQRRAPIFRSLDAIRRR